MASNDSTDARGQPPGLEAALTAARGQPDPKTAADTSAGCAGVDRTHRAHLLLLSEFSRRHSAVEAPRDSPPAARPRTTPPSVGRGLGHLRRPLLHRAFALAPQPPRPVSNRDGDSPGRRRAHLPTSYCKRSNRPLPLFRHLADPEHRRFDPPCIGCNNANALNERLPLEGRKT